MIGTIFGIMYHYSSREFTELLLAQPIKRSSIFLGQYFGIASSLSASLVFGLGIPFLMYGITDSSETFNFILLLVAGILLTFIFSAIAMLVGIFNSNKIKGFGYAILIWLFFAVIYDGVIMILLVTFSDYPIDRFALFASMLNPIDLSRILILLKLDISALLGYTGALFQKFFNGNTGMIVSTLVLLFWCIAPVVLLLRKVRQKDF